jgi:integrase
MPVVRLDAAFVRTATCPQGKSKIDYYSDSLQGFILEVRASGKKTYYQRYRDSYGRLKQVRIGGAETISFEKAQKAAIQLKGKIALGENPEEQKKTLKQIPTLDELVQDRYIPHIHASKRRPDFDLGLLRLHVLPRWGQCRLPEIHTEDLQVWLHTQHRSGLSPAYCNHMVTLLGRIYNLAAKWDVPGAEKNPARNINLLEFNNAREIFLNAEETERLIVAVRASKNTQLQYIISLLLLTGMRKRELLDSRWEDVSIERREWWIPMSKSGKPRKVPLSLSAIDVLQAVPRFENCPYVVPNPQTLKPYRSISHTWIIARNQAGLPALRLHDLRHSFASALVNSGRSIYEVKTVLGHANVTITERYAHLNNQTLLDAVDAAAKESGLSR